MSEQQAILPPTNTERTAERIADTIAATLEEVVSPLPVLGQIDTLYYAGIEAQVGGDWDTAEQIYRQVLADRWDEPEVLDRLFEVLMQRKAFAEARDIAMQSLAIRPYNPSALTHMAKVLSDLGQNDDADFYHEAAFQIAPNHPLVRWNRALHLLKMGRWYAGWGDYHWGQFLGLRPRRHPQPEWDGQRISPSFPRATLYLWAEQGIGDTLMMLRFVAAAKRHGGFARVVLEVQPALIPLVMHPLVRQHLGADVITATPNDKSFAAHLFDEAEGDQHISLMSLPAVMGRTGIPVQPSDITGTPYLPTNYGPFGHNETPFSEEDKRLHIGVCWRGSRGHKGDAMRSIDAETFAPLLARFRDKPVTFHLLSPDAPPEDLERLQKAINGEAFSPDAAAILAVPQLPQWLHTAQLLPRLDFLVSVDTAVAHLAGAMGIPTALLLAAQNDWRWLRAEDGYATATVWYNSVVLFRQQQLGDWSHPLWGAGEAIDGLLKARDRDNERETLVESYQSKIFATLPATEVIGLTAGAGVVL
jgi:hypothetical protein